MSHVDKLQHLKTKLSELIALDAKFSVFGAEKHKYQLNGTKSESDIINFESRYGIKLPDGYRNFLISVGNGGAGPYYGLEPIENSLYADLDYRREDDLLNPSQPFQLVEPWNADFDSIDMENEKEYEKFEEQYFDNKWANGLLRISNYGCGVSLNIVVNGSEYGNIWVDDRCNDGGIYPDPYFKQDGRIDFLDWYECWLNMSLKKLRNESIT